MMRMSGPGRNFIGNEERREVLDVLESGHLFRFGLKPDPEYKQKVVMFEDEFKEFMGTKYCLAVTSGTAALLTSLAALGIGPSDEVVVPGYTFVSSISAIIYSRAIPILAEIDESLTLDPSDLEKRISRNTKAIMPVHMLGNPCQMDAIMDVADKHGLYVLEDCCQAVGGMYREKRLGSIGKIGAYSLNHMKVISTGDGGAVVTDDDEIYERAFGFHDQGHKPSRFGEEIGRRSIIGMNFRMNELTGAVALAQTRKLATILSILREKKRKLKEHLINTPGLGFRKINDENGDCSTLLTLLFDTRERADRFAREIGTMTLNNSGWHVYNNMEHILAKKMPTDIGCPFDCKEYGKDVGYKQNMLPRTDNILQRSVNISVGVVDRGLGASFGVNVTSTDDEIEEVATRIKRALKSI
jgi:8-amino-3,8-dideoxy-alpha-D-manno-octulosonate transaminase